MLVVEVVLFYVSLKAAVSKDLSMMLSEDLLYLPSGKRTRGRNSFVLGGGGGTKHCVLLDI